MLAASPLQDPAYRTLQEVRLLAVSTDRAGTSAAWLDRRLIGGGLHHIQLPACIHADDFSLPDSALTVDLSMLLDVAGVHSGCTVQQVPNGHHGGGLVPISALFQCRSSLHGGSSLIASSGSGTRSRC